MESLLSHNDFKNQDHLVWAEGQTLLPLLDNSNKDKASEQMPSPVDQARQLFLQGIEQQKKRKLEASLDYFQKALTIYTERKNQRGAKKSLAGLALTSYFLGDWRKAIDYAQTSLAIHKQTKANADSRDAKAFSDTQEVTLKKLRLNLPEMQEQQMEGQVRGILANSYRHLGENLKALYQSQKSLTIMRQLQDKLGEVATLNNIGLVYKALGDWQQAIAYQQQSLKIAQSLKAHKIEQQILKNLGNACYGAGDYAQAREYYKQRLAIVQSTVPKAIARDKGDLNLESQILKNIINACFALGDYQQAIEYGNQRLSRARKIGDRRCEEQALGSLGVAYEALGDDQKAIECYEQRLSVARAISDARVEKQALSSLRNACYAIGDYAKVLYYNDQSVAASKQP
jgi:tetratricopeptide (TPR) repeat protein